MTDNSLLKEILDSLHDVDTINLFASANGLTGDTEVENRLKELEWNQHIDNLWNELLFDLEPTSKRPRQSLDNDQPSTSVQSGGGVKKGNLISYGKGKRGPFKKSSP
jgi:hypothetical protein